MEKYDKIVSEFSKVVRELLGLAESNQVEADIKEKTIEVLSAEAEALRAEAAKAGKTAKKIQKLF